MIAFAHMLIEPALQAGMPVPDDPENFDTKAFPHFYVFCATQLGTPMPTPHAHWDNAKIIAAIPADRITQVSIVNLIDLGCDYGFSTP